MANRETAPGARIYSVPLLSFYDLTVLGASNAVVWRCPTRLQLEHYNAHVSARHLDVGVGTGYFLDHCAFPVPDPALTLMDLNPNSLAMAGRRLQRYHPTAILTDATAPEEPPTAPFDSIGMNYLLHCLPGPIDRKAAAIAGLAALLAPGGTLFGATILGGGVPHTPLARMFQRFYNSRGIFDNKDDSPDALNDALSAHLHAVDMHIVGSVVIFAGRR